MIRFLPIVHGVEYATGEPEEHPSAAMGIAVWSENA